MQEMWRPCGVKSYNLFYCVNKNTKKCKSIRRIHENGNITISSHSKSCSIFQRKVKKKMHSIKILEKKENTEIICLENTNNLLVKNHSNSDDSILLYGTGYEGGLEENIIFKNEIKKTHCNSNNINLNSLIEIEDMNTNQKPDTNRQENNNIEKKFNQKINKKDFEGQTKTHKYCEEITKQKILAFPKIKYKEPKLKLPKQIKNDREKLKNSLLEALKEKGLHFCDDLKFPQGKINIPKKVLESIQKLSKENEFTFAEFKVGSRNFNYGPVVVEKMEPQGFIVRATRNIPSHTIISEYVGLILPYNIKTMEGRTQ